MSKNDKMDKLSATSEEVLEAAETESGELSEHERPMVIGVINEA
jgi:hypothetical protein